MQKLRIRILQFCNSNCQIVLQVEQLLPKVCQGTTKLGKMESMLLFQCKNWLLLVDQSASHEGLVNTQDNIIKFTRFMIVRTTTDMPQECLPPVTFHEWIPCNQSRLKHCSFPGCNVRYGQNNCMSVELIHCFFSTLICCTIFVDRFSK